jgi:hypothetical protein
MDLPRAALHAELPGRRRGALAILDHEARLVALLGELLVAAHPEDDGLGDLIAPGAGADERALRVVGNEAALDENGRLRAEPQDGKARVSTTLPGSSRRLRTLKTPSFVAGAPRGARE